MLYVQVSCCSLGSITIQVLEDRPDCVMSHSKVWNPWPGTRIDFTVKSLCISAVSELCFFLRANASSLLTLQVKDKLCCLCLSCGICQWWEEKYKSQVKRGSQLICSEFAQLFSKSQITLKLAPDYAQLQLREGQKNPHDSCDRET